MSDNNDLDIAPEEIWELSPGESESEPKSQSLDEENNGNNFDSDEKMDLEEEAPDTSIRHNVGKAVKKKKGLAQREQINKMAAKINNREPELETRKRKAGPALNNDP